MEFALQQLALISRSGEGLLAAEGMRIRFAAPAQTVFFSAKCTVVHLALVEKVISRYAAMYGFVKEYFARRGFYLPAILLHHSRAVSTATLAKAA